MADYTQWLNSARPGSGDEYVVRSLYVELKQIAAARMSMERQGHTLNATSLVHEAWIRLEKSSPEEWRDRRQFFAAAAEAMRRILVDAARSRLAVKRGGGEIRVPLDEVEIACPVKDERLIGIHEVLDRLEGEDEMKARIVKLRFFSGLGNDEIAALLEVNEKTVRRHWELAKLWLYRAMQDIGPN